jgi:hypothetical protein
MSSSATTRPNGYAKTAIEKVALVVGIVFLLVGIAGFIPGLTSGLDTMQFAGHDSEAMLLGVFQVSIFHNIVHLLFGVVGIAVAGSSRASRNYLIWGGVIYAVLWIYGLFTGDADSGANFVPLNSADNWLHLVLALGMILLGVFVGRDRAQTRGRTA